MKKALITLALLPLLGAGCLGSTAPDNEGPYTSEPTPASSEVTPQENPATAETGGTAQPVVQTPTNSLMVETQKAGNEVVAKNVNLAKPGYVVIHVSTDGKPGNVVGVSDLLNAGETKEVYIKVDITSDNEYFAMLHTDDGDKKFILAKDAPIKDADGNIVMTKFGVTK